MLLENIKLIYSFNNSKLQSCSIFSLKTIFSKLSGVILLSSDRIFLICLSNSFLSISLISVSLSLCDGTNALLTLFKSSNVVSSSALLLTFRNNC